MNLQQETKIKEQMIHITNLVEDINVSVVVEIMMTMRNLKVTEITKGKVILVKS